MSKKRCRFLIGILWVGILAGMVTPILGQRSSGRRGADKISVHLYALRYQRAEDALRLILPLLSEQGSVELRPGGNTIVVRELASRLDTVLEALRRFDHETREVSVSLWLVRAGRGAPVSPPSVVDPELREYPEVLDRLRDHLQYSSFDVVGSSEARGGEGQTMTFDLSTEYEVRFRLGTVVGLERVPLEGFEVFKRPEGAGSRPKRLLRSNLNSWLDRPLVLALSAGETNALMVVIRCELMETEQP